MPQKCGAGYIGPQKAARHLQTRSGLACSSDQRRRPFALPMSSGCGTLTVRAVSVWSGRAQRLGVRLSRGADAPSPVGARLAQLGGPPCDAAVAAIPGKSADVAPLASSESCARADPWPSTVACDIDGRCLICCARRMLTCDGSSRGYSATVSVDRFDRCSQSLLTF
jgi:hypothetical protein